MTPHHYILDENKKVIPAGLFEWAMFLDNPLCIVKQETVGDIWISTVFLGLDHRFTSKGPPILWETMCFDADMSKGTTVQIGDEAHRFRKTLDNLSERCSGTWEQAEAMHERMVERVKQLQKRKDKK